MSANFNFRILTGFVCESRLGICLKATFAVLFLFFVFRLVTVESAGMDCL